MHDVTGVHDKISFIPWSSQRDEYLHCRLTILTVCDLSSVCCQLDLMDLDVKSIRIDLAVDLWLVEPQALFTLALLVELALLTV